jgi:hypothetical protein
MDAIMRGTFERFVDAILKNENLLEAVRATFEKTLECPIEKVEDIMFGYVVGRIIQFSDAVFQLNFQRIPNHEEALEIGEMIVRRATEIKSKIKIIVNR